MLTELERLRLITLSSYLDGVVLEAEKGPMSKRAVLSRYSTVHILLGRAQGAPSESGLLEMSVELHNKMSSFGMWAEAQLGIDD